MATSPDEGSNKGVEDPMVNINESTDPQQEDFSPEQESQVEAPKTPETVADEIDSSADLMVDQFEADIPESAKGDPRIEKVVDKAHEQRENLDTTIETINSGESTPELEENGETSDALADLGAYFEKQYADVDTAAATLGSKEEVKAMYEAMQGKLNEKDFFTPTTFSFAEDGDLKEKNGKSIQEFLQGARKKSEMFASMEGDGEVVAEHKERLKMIDAALSEIEKIRAQEESTETTESGQETKEYTPKDVTEAFAEGMATVERMLANMSDAEKGSAEGQQLARMLENATRAKEQSVDQGKATLTIEYLDDKGNPRLDEEGNPITQEEGIPIEGIIETLKQRDELFNAQDLDEGEQKRLRQLEEIIPANEQLQASGGVVPKNVEHYNDKNIAEYQTLLSKRARFEKGQDQILDSLTPEEKRRVKQLKEVIRENDAKATSGEFVPKNIDHFNEKNKAELAALLGMAKEKSAADREKLQKVITTLEDNSKPYFEKHFGKKPEELSEDDRKKQHTRTEHEAYLISQDERATGTPEGDYALAMETMLNRRELVIPEEAEEPVVAPEKPEEQEEQAEEPVIPQEEKEATDEGGGEEQEEQKEETDDGSEKEPTPQEPEEPVVTPEKPEEQEEELKVETETATLEELRNAYAVAVNGRKKFFGRVSKEHVEEIRGRYEGLIKENIHKQLVEEFKGMDMKSREVLESFLEKQTQVAADMMQERELLVEALSATQEKTAGKKFKDFWKKHAKLRMVVSAALTGGAVVTGVMGILPASALFLGARTVMAGVGTAMMTEQSWEGLRQRYGKRTKEMSEEKIASMSDQELEEIYAAQSVGAADRGLKRGEKITFFGRKKESETMGFVAKEIEKRRTMYMRMEAEGAKENGMSREELIAQSLESMLKTEEEGHKQLEDRTDWLRKNNIKKWVASGIAGGAMAAFIGLRGVEKLKDLWEARTAAPDGVPETPPAPDGTPEGPPAPEGPIAPEGDYPNPETAVPPGADTAPEVIPDTGAESIVTVEKGDSVWKIVEEQLKERMGEKFTSLSEGEKTHLIDQFKDQVVENPAKFGLEDPDVLTPGQKLNLSELFQGSTIEDATAKTAELSQDQISNIEVNNEILRKWVLEHPGERLTSGNVDTIVEQARQGVAGASEAGKAAAEHLTQDISSQEFAQSYAEWLKDNPDAARMKPIDSIARYAIEQQAQSQEVPEVYNPIAEWIEQNPGKPLDKETFLKLVNGPTAQEALEASGQLQTEAVGRVPKALESLAKFEQFAASGETIELKAGVKALKKVGEVTDELLRDGNDATVRGLTDLKLSSIMKGVKTQLEKMPGMTDDMADKFAKAAKEIVKQADKSHGSPVDRNWTLGMLSKVVRLSEKGK